MTTVPEDDQVAAIVGRLERRYPAARIARTEQESRVRGFYRQFDAARVRTFVAVFVERLARISIEEQLPHTAR
jgi:hypothetical protein